MMMFSMLWLSSLLLLLLFLLFLLLLLLFFIFILILISSSSSSSSTFIIEVWIMLLLLFWNTSSAQFFLFFFVHLWLFQNNNNNNNVNWIIIISKHQSKEVLYDLNSVYRFLFEFELKKNLFVSASERNKFPHHWCFLFFFWKCSDFVFFFDFSHVIPVLFVCFLLVQTSV